MNRIGRIVLAFVLAAAVCCTRNTGTPAGEERPLVLGVPHFLSPDKSPGVKAAFDSLTGARYEVRSYVGASHRVREKMRLDASSSEPPDVLLVKGSWINGFVADGLLIPFAQLDPAETADWIRPFRGLRRDGRWLAVPFDADVRVVWYRKDLFEKEGLPSPENGWSTAEFERAASALTDRNAGGKPRYGFAAPLVRNPKSALAWLSFYLSMGGDPRPASPAAALPAGPRSLDLYRRLTESGALPASLLSADQDSVVRGVASGTFAMASGGSWEYDLLRKAATSDAAIRAAPVPVGTGQRPVSLCNGWCWIATARDAETRRRAADAALSLAGPKAQTAKWRAQRFLPVRRDAYRDPAFETNPVFRVMRDAIRTAAGPMDTDLLDAGPADAIALALQKTVLGEAAAKEAWSEAAKVFLLPQGNPATVSGTRKTDANESGPDG